jgi:hypothetical protein
MGNSALHELFVVQGMNLRGGRIEDTEIGQYELKKAVAKWTNAGGIHARYDSEAD